MENYSLTVIAGCFSVISVLLAALISIIRDRVQKVPDIRNTFLDEIDSIIKEMTIPRSFKTPLEEIGFFSRNKLGTVNYTAFIKTCTRRQRQEIEIAYQAYGKSENKYEALLHLKNLVEKIINGR